MNVIALDTIQDLKDYFQLSQDALLLETHLDIIETDCDYFERRRRDAEVLCTIAANSPGKILDLGTSHGRSAYKMATNARKTDQIFTVNLLPEQFDPTEKHPTHLLTKDEIGSFYRKFNLTNIEQLYANTKDWDMPQELSDLSMVFVDAGHDTELVYSDSKLIYDRVKSGGFILWHDFSPAARSRHDWIHAVMLGVEQFVGEFVPDAEIVHLKNSWIGICKKP